MIPDKKPVIRVLEIDGGGLRGVISAVVASKLEAEFLKKRNKKIYEVFDLITGTSTGAIIGGSLACGVPAQKIKDIYITKGAQLFRNRLPFNPQGIFGPIYSRRYIKNELKNAKNDSHKKLEALSLNDVKTKLILTAFNLCSNRTHFIKSWNGDQNHYPVVEAISWSALSAAC
jgi:patatin-like phospholipase/acyl hydrolase